MLRLTIRLLALVAGLVPALAVGQGVLIIVDPEPIHLPRPIIIHPPYWPHPTPPPPASYKISQVKADAHISDQVARVQMSQSFVNTGSRPIEASFVFPLPYDGAIDQMTLMVDGREYPARLHSAEEARRIYEDIVRRNRDPALLEWMGTGMFKTSVFPIPPGGTRTVSLRYSQLCRQSQGLVDFILPLSTAKYTSHPVQEVSVRVSLESREDLKNVYSPTHAVEIQRPDARHAVVSYQSRDSVPEGDFRLMYDEGRGRLSTRVLSYRPDPSQDGYFLLLASPQIKAAVDAPQRKTVVFAIDRSGSMTGKKIEQVCGALKFALNNLRQGDLFNIVAYDSEIESFRPELQRYDDQTRKAALAFADGLYAGGSTNIDGALARVFGQLQDNRQPAYVFFLTDGIPTTGETNEAKIVVNARRANTVGARIFAFGVGYDVNSRLLDKLVRQSSGQSEFVAPDEDIEARISRLYSRVESPVLTDVRLEFTSDAAAGGPSVNRLYPKGSLDLFAGEQLVIVGRYRTPGAAKVVVRGHVGDQPQTFDFPAELVGGSRDDSLAFVEKLWAVRRVGEILDEIDLNGKNSELVGELLDLSTRYGILTPYTSFMADENTSLKDVTSNSRRLHQRVLALDESSGGSGVAQRAMKGALQRADNLAAEQGGYSYGPASLVPAAVAAPAASAGYGFGGRQGAGVAGSHTPALQAAGSAYATAMSAAGAQAPTWQAEADREAAGAAASVRNVGNRAFYRRQGQWMDSTITSQQEPQARRVKQFSDEYFALANRYGRQFTQYAVFDEPVMVNVAGQAYLIER